MWFLYTERLPCWHFHCQDGDQEAQGAWPGDLDYVSGSKGLGIKKGHKCTKLYFKNKSLLRHGILQKSSSFIPLYDVKI